MSYSKPALLVFGLFCSGCGIVLGEYADSDGFPECYQKHQTIICDWTEPESQYRNTFTVADDESNENDTDDQIALMEKAALMEG